MRAGRYGRGDREGRKVREEGGQRAKGKAKGCDAAVRGGGDDSQVGQQRQTSTRTERSDRKGPQREGQRMR